MATVTELGLRLDQHEVHVRGFVRTVTACAANAISKVFRFREVLGLETRLMALRANRCRLRRTQRFEADDLGNVSAAIDVGLSRTVTGLASMLVAF